MKPILTLLLLFLLITRFSLAQTIIKGKIQENNGTPVSYATVLLLNGADSLMVKGAVTSESGDFTLPVGKPGKYMVKASSVGYDDFLSSTLLISQGQSEVDMGAISLSEAATELGEVVIEAEKPIFEQHIDRTVINVQSSITSSAGTALDVLEKAPGVTVDRVNNNLSLSGKGGIRIMINGKMNRMPLAAAVQMLNGINAENLDRIEIITTPPAKYEAEGNAGIINIVLKQTADAGTNGSFSVFGGYGEGEKAGGSINFNHRKKKVNIFGDYSFRRNHTKQTFFNNRILIDSLGLEEETNTYSFRDAVTTVHNGRIGIDYQIGPNTTIGGLFSGFRRNWDMDAFNEVTVTRASVLESTIGLATQEINEWRYMVGNINFSHTFATRHNISVETDYIDYDADNPTDYQQETFDEQGNLTDYDEFRVRKETPIETWVPRLDYTYKIDDDITLEAGAKATFYKLENDIVLENLENGIWVIDSTLSQKADLEENIYAGYGSISFKASPQVDIKIGLRYEHTITQLDTDTEQNVVDRNFGNLFPSVFFNHKINDDNSWVVSYSRRITRPTFIDIAPFVIFLDPNTFWTGNESLKPAITDAVKAEYRYKAYLISFQYSRDQDAIARFQPRVDEENSRQLTSAENMDSRDNFSITLALPIGVTDWWEMQYNVIGTYQILKAGHLETPVELTNLSLNINGANTFKLPKKFTFEISGFSRSPSLFGISEFQSVGSLNLGLEKKLNNDGGAFRFNVTDLLDTRNFKGETLVPEENIDIRRGFDIEGQIFNLTYTRNFGNRKLKGVRKKSGGSEEEQRRLQ